MSELRRITERYRLDKLLAASDGGSVFRATDTQSGETVAVKLINGEGAEAGEQHDRFLAACGALQSLRHPGLPRVLDFGFTTAGTAFLVTEYLDGTSFAELAGSSPGRVLSLLSLVVDGLEALARQGLASDNLQAANLLVVPGADGEQIKILGLGSPLLRAEAAPSGLDGYREDLRALGALASQTLRVTSGAPGAPGEGSRVEVPLEVAAELADLGAFRSLIAAASQGDPEGSFPSWVEVRNALRPRRAAPQETVILSHLSRPTEEEPGNETRLILPPGEHTLAVPRGDLSVLPAGADSGGTVRLDLSRDADAVPAPPSPPVLPPLPPLPPAAKSPPLPPLPPLPPVPAAPPRAGNWRGLLLGVGALAAVLLLAAGLFGWRHRAPQPPQPLPASAPATPAAVPPPTPAIVPPVPVASPAPAASPPAEPALDVAGLKANLSRALESGDLRRLRTVANSVSPKDEAGLPGALRRELERARQALEAEASLSRAEKAGDHLDVIRQAAALLRDLPGAARAGELRDQAARAVEAEVDSAIDAGQYDAAASRLEGLRQAWPERAGLGARTDRIAAEKKSDQEMESLLAAASRSEKANKPLEGLQLLAGVKPSRRYADRFQDQRQRLTAQFAQADRQAPVLVLRSPEAEYEKGKTATILLRITDDFAVKSAEGWARAEGGQYAKVAVRHLSGADYAMDVSPDLHQNKTIELYVTAVDPSGHTGQLGSADRPLKMKRKGFLKSIFGGKDEG